MESYGLSRGDLDALIPDVYDDFRTAAGPFREDHRPARQVRGGFLDDSEHCLFLTLVAGVAKRTRTTGTDGLWRVAKRLWRDQQWIFQPPELVETHQYGDLIDLFTETPRFNYYEDPHVWYLNSLTFYRHFDSSPLRLLEAVEFDAPRLLETVREERREQFHSLGGEAVGTLWIRLLHEEVHPLDRIEAVDLRVDAAVRRLTNALVDGDRSAGDVRRFWREFCADHDLVPVQLEVPLRLLARHAEEWGEDYLHEKLGAL
jgi:hypothetical protein